MLHILLIISIIQLFYLSSGQNKIEGLHREFLRVVSKFVYNHTRCCVNHVFPKNPSSVFWYVHKTTRSLIENKKKQVVTRVYQLALMLTINKQTAMNNEIIPKLPKGE